MYHRLSFTVPANTERTAPVESVLHLCRGTIRAIEEQWPRGPAWLCGFSVWHRGSQIYPWERDSWAVGNEVALSHRIDYPLDSEPYDLIFHGYNDDDYFEHTVELGIEFAEGEVDADRSEYLDALRRLLEGPE